MKEFYRVYWGEYPQQYKQFPTEKAARKYYTELKQCGIVREVSLYKCAVVELEKQGVMDSPWLH